MVRVLVVDDDHDTADSLVMLLRVWGHESQRAYDSESAIELALSFVPQLVFLDLGMPRINGLELARQLRQHQELTGVKIVAISGHATSVDSKGSADSGIDRHFTKPISPLTLKEYVDAIATGN